MPQTFSVIILSMCAIMVELLLAFWEVQKAYKHPTMNRNTSYKKRIIYMNRLVELMQSNRVRPVNEWGDTDLRVLLKVPTSLRLAFPLFSRIHLTSYKPQFILTVVILSNDFPFLRVLFCLFALRIVLLSSSSYPPSKALYLRLASNLWSFCLDHINARILGMSYQAHTFLRPFMP